MNSNASERSRLIFLGSPEFASRTLEALILDKQYEIVAVITESDKPAGRGQRLTPTAVKITAIKHNIPVLQPETLRGLKLSEDGAKLTAKEEDVLKFADQLNSMQAIDAMITVAYGKILPKAFLKFPRVATINVHASLLPRWRGAAPIHRALFAGDSKTGVSIMKTVYELDAGPVYYTEEFAISSDDTFGTLHDKLADCGVSALLHSLPGILSGELLAKEQPSSGVTHAAKWTKEDYFINWQESASVSERRIRTCAPIPGARTWWRGDLIKILAAFKQEDQNYPAARPGEIVEVNRAELVVATGEGQFLSIEQLQFPGKKRLPIAEVLKAKPFKLGDVFESSQ